MYRKEIIYLGLYKDGSRIGNAGFLKVEDREAESRLDLKLRNIPFNISGRFPIRIHNGADWNEINGISVKEGGGSWADKMMDSAERVQIQIMLPGGYFLEGKSKNAAEVVSWGRTNDNKNMAVEEERMEVHQAKETVRRNQRQNTQQGVWQDSPQNTQEDLQQRVVQSPQQNTQEDPQYVMQQNAQENQQYTMQQNTQENQQYTMQQNTQENPQYAMQQNTQEDPQYTMQQNTQENQQYTMQQNIQANRRQAVQQGPLRRVREEERKNVYTDRPDYGDSGRKARNLSENGSKTIIITEELQRPAAERNLEGQMPPQEITAAYSLKEDKWEQILDSYEKIHPYGDERVYVKLEPKDFIILQSKYQHLVNNSFLLHGFYNYRYVILGKEQDYYLGVPGVFYEREKMVALMFGFEAFECPGGTARAGEFGYYLRKVEL